MAKYSVPVSVSDRHRLLFNNSPSSSELSRWGNAHHDAGLLHDALEFYKAAKDEASLARLEGEAVEAADLVLYVNTCRALGGEPRTEDLKKLKENALALGKKTVAARVDVLLIPKN
ncbi:MAG: hypothetical protein P8Z49_01050 [Acidobacteriota bacterium]|jgi:hypothetical protein